MDCPNERSRNAWVSLRARWKNTSPTACGSALSECSPSAVKIGKPMHQPMHRLGKESPMNGNETEIQASEWLARLDRDDPSAADLAEFNQWKAADPRNAA